MFSIFSSHKMRFSLFQQILLAMVLLLGICTGSLWAYIQVNLNQLLQQQTDAFAHAISQQAADSSAEMVMADDHLALNAMLDNLVRKTHNIQMIQVYDDANQLLAQSEALNPVSNVLVRQYQADIIFRSVKAGHVQLTLDISTIRETLLNTQQAMATISIAIAFMALIMAIFMARKLTFPLAQLKNAVQVISKGELNPELPAKRNDEVGDLIQSFNQMLQGLRDKEAIEHKFSSYISQDIARDILSDLELNKKPLKTAHGSILFIDIVGFTTLCEQQSPQQTASMLNQYYFLLHQAAKMYRGSVDNFIGDGAMLTFGIHKQDKKHSINAICAAQIFIRLCQIMNNQRKEKGLPSLQFRLGLHCGEMLAGTIGSKERMQFTAFGDTVNLAARLCEMAEPGMLMISDEVYRHPSTSDLLVTQSARNLSVKGKAETIKAYNVTRLAPKFNRLLMQQEAELKAMDAHE